MAVESNVSLAPRELTTKSDIPKPPYEDSVVDRVVTEHGPSDVNPYFHDDAAEISDRAAWDQVPHRDKLPTDTKLLPAATTTAQDRPAEAELPTQPTPVVHA